MNPSELRSWREARGMSRRAAADVLGIGFRTLEALEQGRASGDTLMPVVERLIAALDRIDEIQLA